MAAPAFQALPSIARWKIIPRSLGWPHPPSAFGGHCPSRRRSFSSVRGFCVVSSHSAFFPAPVCHCRTGFFLNNQRVFNVLCIPSTETRLSREGSFPRISFTGSPLLSSSPLWWVARVVTGNRSITNTVFFDERIPPLWSSLRTCSILRFRTDTPGPVPLPLPFFPPPQAMSSFPSLSGFDRYARFP